MQRPAEDGDELWAPAGRRSGDIWRGIRLSIEHFAAIQAALQDGFELEAILEVEGGAEPRWRAGRVHLTQAIAEDADAYAAYQQALEEAQERVKRPVHPLYDDLDAWIGFLLVIDRTPLAELCAKHGLTPGDLDLKQATLRLSGWG